MDDFHLFTQDLLSLFTALYTEKRAMYKMCDDLNYQTYILIDKWQCINKCINNTIPEHECCEENNMIL